jgi:hypothetical protein
MSFFKAIHPTTIPKVRSPLSDQLAPLAAVALAEKASLWRTLDMLTTASASLMFDSSRLVYMRRGWGRHDILIPSANTALSDLVWHLLGAPNSVSDHDQAMRFLAMDLAWYQTTRYIPCTPPEIKEIVYYYGQSTPPDVIYMLVEEQFSGMRRGEDFYLMLRQFKNSLTRSQYVEAHADQGGDT